MTTTTPIGTAAAVLNSQLAEDQERRKVRLTDILSRGLPTLPNYVLDLNVLLGQPAVDLKKVGNVIRTDPNLASQALKLCNSALLGLCHRVISIEQAAILLGTERLRTLVLSCFVMRFAGKRLPEGQLTRFWHHSFLCALLSERLASHLNYCEKEHAYLGGLLHDIGQLPLWSLVIAEETAKRPVPPPCWSDNVTVERAYFGMDHCKVGRWMSVSWDFTPSFIDVCQYHHTPERAEHDPDLVGIVAAADQFLVAHAEDPSLSLLDKATSPGSALVPPAAWAPSAHHSPDLVGTVAPISSVELAADSLANPDALPLGTQLANDLFTHHQEVPAFLKKCLPQLRESEHHAILDMMQTEYLRLVPLVQLGMAIAVSDT